MKKLLFFILPFFLAGGIFFAFLFIQSRNAGKGGLQVTSNPKSKVYLNNQFIGETPLCRCQGKKMITAGKYTLKIVPENSKLSPFENDIAINKSVLTVVDRTFGQTGTSYGSIITLDPLNNKKENELLVLSLPDNADIYLDENKIGKTPSLLKNITDSNHSIKISKSGYQDDILHIKAVAGYKLTITAFLGINPNLASPTQSNATPSANLQASSSAAPKVVVLETPTGFLNVRNKPSLSGSIIAKVKPGDKLDLINQEAGWFEIRLSNGSSGWISGSYAKKE
ncbi:PEGA domain-containing protein [Patescibacteria group bacterium]|nr:PEGA domain-containing protein [Patescibacteria group bacterium]MCL5010054.1 PEGA domain-containing protein [Patescibacteria group bacterium]